jgi:PAS domain S-box-containing protein
MTEIIEDSEINFRNLFENSPVGKSMTGINGSLHVNKSFCDILGYAEEELRTKKLMDITHPDDIRRSNDFIQSLLSGKIAQARFEKRYLHKNGNTVWAEVSTYLQRDKDNKPQFFITTIIDITERKEVEKQLIIAKELAEESEKSFHALFENMIEGFAYCQMIFDNNNPIDFIYLEVNAAFEPLTGLKNVTGKRVSEVIPGIQHADTELFQIYARVALTGKPERFEMFVESLMDWYAVSVYSPKKEYFVAAFDVITNRKKAEEALKLNEARLESLLKINLHPAETIQELLDFALNEAITLTGSKIGYIYFYDEVKKEFTLNTWSKEVMQQCTVAETHPIYQLDETGIWGEAVRQRKPIMVNEFEAPNALKKGLPEGHVPLKKFLTIPVFNQNNIVAVVGVANKLTDYNDSDILQLKLMMDAVWKIVQRKQAEEKLRESEEFNRFLLRTIPFAMDIVDENGNILFQSENFIKLFGIEALTQKCWQLYRDDKTQCIDCPLVKGIQIGKTELYESHGVMGGKTFQISHTGMLFHGKKAMLEIFQDITERKQEEEQLVKLNHQLKELNATKDKLFSIIAHDLKGPFSSILNLSELLHETLHNDMVKSETFIEHINSSAKNTLILLDNLLNWAKTQTGKIKFEPERLSLQPIIQGIVTLLSSSAKMKNIVLRNFQSEDIMVAVDRNMIDTILRNLISNAIKFSHSGGTVNIFAISHLHDVEIVIADEGVGMNEKTQNQILNIDANVSTTGTANEKGSGLGLILCREFVEKHEGKIWVESELNKGTKFHFTLPK